MLRTSRAVSSLLGVRRVFSTLPEFEDAKDKLSRLSEEPDNETKLKIYGLFKQATTGNVQGSRPSAFDFVNRAKWDAWKANEGISKEDAQKTYAEIINRLAGTDAVAPEKGKSGNEIDGLKVTVEDKIFKIQLDRPTKFNAITWEMYEGLITALNHASKDRTTSVTVLTGSGDYYCSGNDLTNFMKVKTPADMQRMVQEGSDVLKRFVKAFIDHDKPLIALINGPAVGISVTVLAMFDLVIASDRATFHTPFASLGQSAEGCSTYTFPMLMGVPKASEFLLFGRKLTAQEAYERNLVTMVIPDSKFREETERKVKELSALPPNALRLNKVLLRDLHRDGLHRANDLECKLLAERWQSTECLDALKSFMTRKK